MGWATHQRIAITANDRRVLVQPSATGRRALTKDGFLRLPAAVRHHYGIQAGDRLLLAALPDKDVMFICFVAVLDKLLDQTFGGIS